MNKAELVQNVVNQTNLSRRDAQKVVEIILETIVDTLKVGQDVNISGFGRFSVASRAASEGRNPRTGEKIKIAAPRKPRFRAFAALKRQISGRADPVRPTVNADRNISQMFVFAQSLSDSQVLPSSVLAMMSIVGDLNFAIQAVSRFFWRACFSDKSREALFKFPISGSVLVGDPIHRMNHALVFSPAFKEPRRLTKEIFATRSINELAHMIRPDPNMPAPDPPDLEDRMAELARMLGPELIYDVLTTLSPEILVGPPPQMVDLCVPSPAWELASLRHRTCSTSGAIARNDEGILGVTGALHATGKQGDEVVIAGQHVPILSHDEITDSVFIQLPEGINVPPLTAENGVMTSRAPWQGESAVFSGITNPEGHTVVSGFDSLLPRHYPGLQLRVFTNPDIDYGDSGSALVNGDGFLLGFAYQRTEVGAPYQFATWVWAHSVFQTLRLTSTA